MPTNTVYKTSEIQSKIESLSLGAVDYISKPFNHHEFLARIWAIRYSLFWIALEALFGPEDAREITYRLSQRVAFFLGHDRADVKGLFSLTKKGYAYRSKIVHGRWKEDAGSESQMAEAEDLVRRSLVRVLEDQELIKTFSGKTRESFLDDLVF